jgi:hypothetical protein
MECNSYEKSSNKYKRLVNSNTRSCVVSNVCCAAVASDDDSEELNVCYNDQDGNFKIAML